MTEDKAWIVSRGAYSDYRVIAVFTEKEKADNFVEQSNDALNEDRFRVEEQRLNPKPKDYNRYAWARINKDGKVAKYSGNSRMIGASGTDGNIYDSYKVRFREEKDLKYSDRPASVTVVVPSHDTDKAVKVGRKIVKRAKEEAWWGNNNQLKKELKKIEQNEEIE